LTPLLNRDPGEVAVVGVIVPPQLSVTVGTVHETDLVHCPAAVVVTMLLGQTITGSTLSVTVIVKEHEAVFKLVSVDE